MYDILFLLYYLFAQYLARTPLQMYPHPHCPDGKISFAVSDTFFASLLRFDGRLPEELKQALHQWQTFLASRLGRQPSPAEAEAIFAEFAQMQPFYAQQVQNFVHAHGGTTGAHPQGMPGQPRHVPVAEV